jgi:hypothetical protein
MEKQIKIGPIQRRKQKDVSAIALVRKQINKMKLGEFFEVTGLNGRAAFNLRASITYYSKKESFRVVTKLKGDTLVIERVRK